MLTTSGPLKYFTFAPSQLAVVAPSATGDPEKTVPISPTDILASSGGIAALNGPFFDTAAGDSYSYATTPYEVLLARHFDPKQNVNASGTHPNTGSTISVVGNRASMLPGDVVAQGADVAIQGWPTLVQGGVPLTIGDTASASRAALAIMQDGQLALVSSASLTLTQFARALQAIGATDAINMDGGGSTALVTPGAAVGSRRVASWLVVMPATGMLFSLGILFVVGGLLWATVRGIR